MAVGKATVTTRIGCDGLEGVHRNHYLVADEPVDFAKSVVEILSDSSLQRRLGENARELAIQEYDWGKLNQKMDLICQNLAR